jgi:hypothetical protein
MLMLMFLNIFIATTIEQKSNCLPRRLLEETRRRVGTTRMECAHTTKKKRKRVVKKTKRNIIKKGKRRRKRGVTLTCRCISNFVMYTTSWLARCLQWSLESSIPTKRYS